MNKSDAEDTQASTRPDHPAQFQRSSPGRNSYDSYPSDDEDLEDGDLNVLDTDYAAQRNLSFYPIHQQSNPRYHPNTAPSLQQAGGTRAAPPSASLGQSTYDGPYGYRSPQHNAHAYQEHRKRRPLIDLIKNEWQNAPYTASDYPSPSPDFLDPKLVQILTAPRLRRYVFIMFGLIILIWGNWHSWLGHAVIEHRLLDESLRERIKIGGGWFGANMRPQFLDMIHLKTLDQSLIPQGDNRRRLIVIGDVHGCHEERTSMRSCLPTRINGRADLCSG